MSASEPITFAVEHVGDADFCFISFDALDGSGENPRVAVENGAFTAGFQIEIEQVVLKAVSREKGQNFFFTTRHRKVTENLLCDLCARCG